MVFIDGIIVKYLNDLNVQFYIMLVGASTYNLCLFKQAHWEVQLFLCSKKVAWRYSWKLDRLSLAGIL